MEKGREQQSKEREQGSEGKEQGESSLPCSFSLLYSLAPSPSPPCSPCHLAPFHCCIASSPLPRAPSHCTFPLQTRSSLLPKPLP